jgi:hypothetical protein
MKHGPSSVRGGHPLEIFTTLWNIEKKKEKTKSTKINFKKIIQIPNESSS